MKSSINTADNILDIIVGDEVGDITESDVTAVDITDLTVGSTSDITFVDFAIWNYYTILEQPCSS